MSLAVGAVGRISKQDGWAQTPLLASTVSYKSLMAKEEEPILNADGATLFLGWQ